MLYRDRSGFRKSFRGPGVCGYMTFFHFGRSSSVIKRFSHALDEQLHLYVRAPNAWELSNFNGQGKLTAEGCSKSNDVVSIHCC